MPLADFGTVAFTNCAIDGQPVGAAISNQIDMTSSAGGAEATTSSLGSDGASFSVTYAPTAPLCTVAPRLSGTAALGERLACTSGTWTGSPSPGLAYQWLRDGEAIVGATQSTYVVGLTDCGKSLSCQVTGQSAAGQASARSNLVRARPAPAPNLRLSCHVLSVGQRVTISGTVSHLLNDARTVFICSEASSRFTVLKRLTMASSGTFHWTMTATKSGVWRLLARYKAAGVSFSSKSLALTVRKQ
jgi:hypothetical protein